MKTFLRHLPLIAGSIAVGLLLLPTAAAQVSIYNNSQSNQQGSSWPLPSPYYPPGLSASFPYPYTASPVLYPWYPGASASFSYSSPFLTYPHPYGSAYGDCSQYGPGAFFDARRGRCEYYPTAASTYPQACTGRYRTYVNRSRRERECFCAPGEVWSTTDSRCVDITTYCAIIDPRAVWDPYAQACQCIVGYRADDTGRQCISSQYGSPRVYTRYVFE